MKNYIIIDKKEFEKQITLLGDQLNKVLTEEERQAIEGILNVCGDIADHEPNEQINITIF